ncbi:MAG: hypothetical protein LBM18_00775 [Oscillospiraceae bacterium]|jgi:hypothetical protein|nr:hypothetical protein [Oscillospiraceae bacterium]
MRIYKAGVGGAVAMDSGRELKLINEFSKGELSAEQVYTFSVVLCDNEVDRDYEKFSREALERLAVLFVGKTGIFDHDWKSANQTARLYRTEVIESSDVLNSVGEPYCALRGYAYMLRSEKNQELIAEIDAGIKKETSVGCAADRKVCSICGEVSSSGGCGHVQGREYEGKLCYLELFDISDAYEWSFVAVPSQRGAGVVKRFGESAKTLKDFVALEAGRAFAAEYEALEKQAALGREYTDALRSEVLRLALIFDRKAHTALAQSSKHMGASELEALKAVFGARVDEMFPPRTQLPGRNETKKFDGEAYLV